MKLHDNLQILPVDRLIPYARNSRTHDDAQVAQIAASIREFGFTNPVLVDEAGGVIAGHGRILAARKLGLAEVPCLTLAGLTEAQKRAYVIADNKIALNAGWDEELLRIELGELHVLGEIDLGLVGFTDKDLAAYLDDSADLGVMPQPQESSAGGPQTAELIACPKCGCRFEPPK